MKILTIKQPFATAILKYGKDVENRTWTTNYRGEILVHTSRSKPTKKDIEYVEYRIKRSLELEFFPLGCIIGKVNLIDIRTNSQSQWALHGQYHWILDNPEIFDPIYCKGKLGLWFPDKELLGLLKPNLYQQTVKPKPLQLTLF